MNVETLNFWLALGTIAMQAAAVALLALYIFHRKVPELARYAQFFGQWGLWLGFLLTLGTGAMTLVYSEIIGFPPCPLCWWQRVFLYPQIVLFGLALWKRLPGESKRLIADYSIVLSAIGLGIALYHHALQILPSGSLPCPAEGEISCAQRFVFEFGYITFPLMAATLFAFLIVIMLFVRSTKN